MASAEFHQYPPPPNSNPRYEWGPTSSADSEDTSIANNTTNGSSRLSGQSNNNDENLASRAGAYRRKSSSTRTIDENASAAMGASCYTFATNMTLAPSTNSHHLQGGASDVGAAGCTADLRNLWRNAAMAFPQHDGRSRTGRGQGSAGRPRGLQKGQSILDYVTGCGQEPPPSSAKRATATWSTDLDDTFLTPPRNNTSRGGGVGSGSGSGRKSMPAEPTSQGMEIDQFGNARATVGTGMTPDRPPRSTRRITMRELAAGAGFAASGGGIDSGATRPADGSAHTTPSPRDVRALWNDDKISIVGKDGQKSDGRSELDGLLVGRRVSQTAGRNTTPPSLGVGVEVDTIHEEQTNEQRTITTTHTMSTGGAKAPSIMHRARSINVPGIRKKKKSPRSAKYRLAETEFDTGLSVDVDDASTDSFLNVEMLETNPASELVNASGASRYTQSIGGVSTKGKDALGKYKHYESIKIGSGSAAVMAGASAGGALADDLSDILDTSAEEANFAEKRRLYYHQRVRTLGQVHQRQRQLQLERQAPSAAAAVALERSSTTPLPKANRPSLTRVTSGDEHDDDTAMEEMRAVADLYRRGNYASAELPLPTEEIKKKNKSDADATLPLQDLELTRQSVMELRRTVSELTMRSSYGEMVDGIDSNRRMAYYAVGREGSNGNSGGKKRTPGGNRRCYFTGRPIMGRNPFYAGTVQQGLRTLVVFCLPSAIGLPRSANVDAVRMAMEAAALRHVESLHKRENSGLTSFITEETNPDPNETIPPEILLEALPEPNEAIMKAISDAYFEQFCTLPAQVQDPSCWHLYEKFCHFSGLPIASGEVHYRVRPDLVKGKLAKKLEGKFGSKGGKSDKAQLSPSDEIALSHEVMLACNGEDSSEIVRLPNTRCFRYLKKHYPHQCSKIDASVFHRSSWEMVKAEV